MKEEEEDAIDAVFEGTKEEEEEDARERGV